jgi:N-acyl-D-aspartate/D-glutamate deacylase
MGFDRREPNLSELETMEKLVAKAMEEGAFGLSSGLIYVPGSYSQTPELVALAKVSARYGGFYSSHIRGEGATLIPAVEEALTVGREAGLAVQLSHHKASGTANWGMVNSSLRLIDEARAVGQDVLADQYPYTAGWTTLSALMPQWALEGGMEEMRRRFNDPETRSRIIKAISETDPDAGSSQFPVETITVCGIPEGPNKQYDGLPLSEIGKKRGENPVESALYLLANEPNGASIIVHTMSEEDVRQVMSHPAVAIGSDGYSVNPTIGSHLHPRAYGTYTRVLGHYVREEKVLRLEEAVRKMTSLPAQRLGRYDLGLVRPGCQADLVVFDPEQICDMATFSEPHRYSKGIKYVLVNGQIVIESGQDTGVNAGRVLRRNRE